MIDKLESGIGDPIIRGLINKINEIIEEVNDLQAHQLADKIADQAIGKKK